MGGGGGYLSHTTKGITTHAKSFKKMFSNNFFKLNEKLIAFTTLKFLIKFCLLHCNI